MAWVDIANLTGPPGTAVLNEILDRLQQSHLSLDTDGTPYFTTGKGTQRILQDTDGTPYYQPWEL